MSTATAQVHKATLLGLSVSYDVAQACVGLQGTPTAPLFLPSRVRDISLLWLDMLKLPLHRYKMVELNSLALGARFPQL